MQTSAWCKLETPAASVTHPSRGMVATDHDPFHEVGNGLDFHSEKHATAKPNNVWSVRATVVHSRQISCPIHSASASGAANRPQARQAKHGHAPNVRTGPLCLLLTDDPARVREGQYE
jgi:hypothetical protein